MDKTKTTPANIDAYIAACPREVQPKLQELRAAIRAAAPDAKEKISYSMPAFEQGGILVYFAAFKDHLSFFPTGSGVSAFEKELKGFVTSKGTIHLPLEEPLPIELIQKIVRFRVRENQEKARKKK